MCSGVARSEVRGHLEADPPHHLLTDCRDSAARSSQALFDRRSAPGEACKARPPSSNPAPGAVARGCRRSERSERPRAYGPPARCCYQSCLEQPDETVLYASTDTACRWRAVGPQNVVRNHQFHQTSQAHLRQMQLLVCVDLRPADDADQNLVLVDHCLPS
jgi:hypothetical protein